MCTHFPPLRTPLPHSAPRWSRYNPDTCSNCAPNYTYTGAWTTRQIGQNIYGTAAVFKYFDSNGAQLSTANPTDAVNLLPAVRSIEIDLDVQVPGNTGPPASLVDKVRLPNVQIANP